MEIKVNVNVELGSATIAALASALGGNPAQASSAKAAAKPAPKAVAEAAEAEETKNPAASPAAKPAPKATASPAPAAKAVAKPAPKLVEEDFADLDEDAQMEAIKAAVTKHTKKGKTADIKLLLSIYDAPKSSDLDPSTYGDFMELVNRYSAGESAEDIVASFEV